MYLTKKRVTSLFMALILLITGFVSVRSLSDSKTYAVPIEYNNVYYFSDSTPAFSELADSLAGNVTYDQKYLASPQALAYLLYSGYFWGFNCGMNDIPIDYNLAIIELKTIKPDAKTLENLFTVLRRQDCKVMFISPYIDEYGSLGDIETIKCNMDPYTAYLYYCVKSMMPESYFQGATTLLIDGRFFGIYGPMTDYDLPARCLEYAALERMLLYISQWCDSDKEMEFEKEIYKELWQYFYDNKMHEFGYNLTYFDNKDTDIEQYITMWNSFCEQDSNFWRNFHYNNSEEITKCYNEAGELYFANLIGNLDSSITILAHVSGTRYLNIIDSVMDPISAPYEYTFTSYTEIFLDDENKSRVDYFYSMGIWYLDGYFYEMLKDIEKANLDAKQGPVGTVYGAVWHPVYIWPVDEITWSDNGLKIATAEMLMESFGITPIKEADLKDEFYELLQGMLT